MLEALRFKFETQCTRWHERCRGAIVKRTQVVQHQPGGKAQSVVAAIGVEVVRKSLVPGQNKLVRRVDRSAAKRPLRCDMHQIRLERFQPIAH